MVLRAISNFPHARRRPFDRLITRSNKINTYKGRETRSISRGLIVIFIASAVFAVLNHRNARISSLAADYKAMSLLASDYKAKLMENVGRIDITKAVIYTSPVTVHDPHSNAEKIDLKVTQNSEEKQSDVDSTEKSAAEIKESSEPENEKELPKEKAGKFDKGEEKQVDPNEQQSKEAEPQNNNNENQQVSEESKESDPENSSSTEQSFQDSEIPLGLEEPKPGVFLPNAPLHNSNPCGEKFIATDVNNPTKIDRPDGGFPPRMLPSNHESFDMIRSLRKKTDLTPRWPDHPEIHLAELKSYGPAYASIIISDKLKSVYIPVFKVGTTSMMWNIAYLENNQAVINANISQEGIRDYVLHDFTSDIWSDHAIYALDSDRVRATLNDPSYLKFGFVRNPYHRVVSAYLDKVVKWPIHTAEYQGQMYGLYGDDYELRKFRNQTKPTFKEYLSAIEKTISMPRTPVNDLTKSDGYEDNNSRREIHFRPQVELLHPDLIHFDFIGRFHNMKNDTKEVLNWMYQFTDRRMPDNSHKRLHSTDPKDKISIFEKLREDEGLRNTLLRIYKDDFERFGFSKDVPSANEHPV